MGAHLGRGGLGALGACFVACLSGIAACAGAPSAPEEAPEVELASPRRVASAASGVAFTFPARSPVFSTTDFDYASLPVAATPQRPRSLSFALVATRDASWRVEVDTALAARLDANAFRAYSWNRSSSPLSFGVLQSVLGGPKTPFEMEARSQRSPPCGPGEGRHRASLQAVSLHGADDEHVDYERFDAWFDAGRCAGTGTASEAVRARALVPGLLYAFRRSATTTRADEVVIVGPPTIWSGASVEPLERERHAHGTFTVLSAPVRQGGSASLLFQAGWREIAYFVGLHQKAPAWATDTAANGAELEFSIEVVWPADERSPQGRVLVGRSTANADRLLDLRPASGR